MMPSLAQIVRVSLLAMLAILPAAASVAGDGSSERQRLRERMEYSLRHELLQVWYPRSLDTLAGGFLCDFSHDWQPAGPQLKMIVTQTRHVWTASQAAMFLADDRYRSIAAHGFRFLRDKLWDHEYGGFYMLRDRAGGPVAFSYQEEKRAYGNAFAIYALAAYYKISGDPAALQLAQKTFRWLEQHSHDPVQRGYHEHLARNGDRLRRGESATKAWDAPSIGWQDQNSAIHLLEAFTALYHVWPDSLLRRRLEEMLTLVRDVIVDPRGFLILYFQDGWRPVSFRDSSAAVRQANFRFDHISFGHDIETAYLLLEAADALGMPADPLTLAVAKRLVDHALAHGWDESNGGLYDRGYYFAGSDTLTIISKAKVWWVQAEALNALLLMAQLFPQEAGYRRAFQKQWAYIDKFLIDHKHGEWYEEGLDHSPEQVHAPKARDWKVNYHNARALMNCIKMLQAEQEAGPDLR